MSIRQLAGAFGLLLCVGYGQAQIDPLQVWTAAGGEVRLELRADYLPGFGLEILHQGRSVHELVEIHRAFSASDRLVIAAPHGNFEGFVNGAIRLDTGWVLRYRDREVRLDGLTLSPGLDISAHPTLEAYDGAGTHLLTFHHMHILAEHQRGLLTLHNMDFSATAALGERLGLPVLDGLVLGGAWFDLPLQVPAGADTSGLGVDTSDRGLSCTGRPFWPQDFDQHGETIDVGLIAMDFIQHQGNDPGTGRAKFAPSATLKNFSNGDVPWIPKFGSLGSYPHAPPDQHPFLVFNMYRIADGRIQQLGASGVKHAFLTINQQCWVNCGSGNVLWPGCEDVYSTGNNDQNSNMGPRADIEASAGYFDSCNSFFSPGAGCSQTQNSGWFENRLLIDPAQLQTPGAEYFFDAWYVIQYDTNIWNSMGYRPITPTPSGGSGWIIPSSPFTAGRTIDNWVDPDNPGPDADHVALVVPSATPVATYPNNLPQGHINVAVRVSEPQPGRYRYNYAVQNYDFDRGIEGFRVPINDNAQIFETWFGGVDGEPGDDWTITFADGHVNFLAPANHPLGWFMLFNFEIETDAPPSTTEVTLDLGGDAVVPGVTAEILGPDRGPLPIPGDISLEPYPPTGTFSFPVALRHANDGSGRKFVVERAGTIRIIDADDQILPTPFLNITSQVDTFFEGGLLGLAFHPDYADNGLFYVYFTASGSPLTTTIAEFEVDSDNPNLADGSSQRTILLIAQPAGNHNGGDIHFGPDGYLYIGMGDGGPGNTAQNLNTLLGKMLRIDIDNDDFPSDPNRNYAIPADNPFVGASGLDEIWSYGLRNPYRWSFDRDTGDLWIADVGQSTWEEIDMQPAGESGGDNYGWNVCEGNWQSGSTTTPCALAGHTPPVLEYRNIGSHCSVTGGYRYRGPFPSLVGWYAYGDYCSGQLWLAQESDGAWIADEFDNIGFGIVGFGEDEVGHLYLLRSNGQILRFEGTAGAAPVLTSVLPEEGSASGGTAVTLSGEHFLTGAGVTFGGNSCTGIDVVSSTQITCDTPPGTPGSVDVTVTNPDEQSATLIGGFTYTVDPVPELTLSTAALEFGTVEIGSLESLPVVLESTGTATLTVTALDLPDAPFSVDSSACGGGSFALEPGNSCSLSISFAPDTAGGFSDTLSIVSNVAGSPDDVTLNGTGQAQPVPAEFEIDPDQVDFADVVIGHQETRLVTLANVAPAGALPVSLGALEILGGAGVFTIVSNDCDAQIAAEDSCAVEIGFAPPSEQNHSAVLRIVADSVTHTVILQGSGIEDDPSIFQDRFEQLTWLIRTALAGR